MFGNKMVLDKLYDHQLSSHFFTVSAAVSLGLIFATSSYAGLSAHSVLTIQGTKPYIQLVDQHGVVTGDLMTLEQLVGFTMPDGSGGIIQKDASHSVTNGSPIISLPYEIKFSDIVTLVKADGMEHDITGAADDDGDADNGSATITGNMTATWYDYNGRTIIDLDKSLTVCEGPYDLMIEANDVGVETTYGDPRTNTYGSQTPVMYTFQPGGLPRFCYIMTGSPSVFSTAGAPGVNSKYPGTGYNPDVWVGYSGFSVDKLRKLGLDYPTTGFNKAVLKFQASGVDWSNKDKYRCTTTSSWITLSTIGYVNNCAVTYNTTSKPVTPAVINLEYFDGNSWVQADSYTIPVPTKWATVKGLYAYANNLPIESATAFPAASMCKDDTITSVTTAAEADTYLFSLEELTNAPSASLASSASPSWVSNSSERFVRDVDGTFSGEWGALNNGYYPGSGLASDDNSYSWTKGIFNIVQAFAYSQYTGYVYTYQARAPLTTICK